MYGTGMRPNINLSSHILHYIHGKTSKTKNDFFISFIFSLLRSFVVYGIAEVLYVISLRKVIGLIFN